MRYAGFAARPLVLAMALVLGFALSIQAQDATGDQAPATSDAASGAAPGTAPGAAPAKHARPAHKPARPAPRPMPKAGEIIPMDPGASGDSAPASSEAAGPTAGPASEAPATSPASGQASKAPGAPPAAMSPATSQESPALAPEAPAAPASKAPGKKFGKAQAKPAAGVPAQGPESPAMPAPEMSAPASSRAASPAPAAVPEAPAPAPTSGSSPASAMVGAPEAPAHGRGQKAMPLPAMPLPARSKAPGGRLTIGALLPLTGHLTAQGQMSKAAVELAVSDINAHLAETGSSERVSIQIEDTASDGPKALEGLRTLAASGVRLIVGPYSDNEVDSVLEFANKNGLVLLSQGSAGPYLDKPGNNLFRFSPSDAFQAEALAVLANQEGCTQLITIWEGDMYGDELITHIKGQFANLGGQVIAGTRFRPETNQFGSFVADLKAQIDKSVKDKKKLAIVVAARGSQTAGILREAAKLAGLSDAKWYGCDDSALRGAITEDQTVAKFAEQVRMAFARYGETGTTLYSNLEKRLEDRIHAFVDTQAVVAYDIVWLAATTAMTSGDDPAALRKAIPAAAERFYGASGWLALNEKGDRRENYDFDFWTIKYVDGKFYWVKTARYQFDPGSVKQLIINTPEKE